MRYADLNEFMSTAPAALAKGPVGMIFVEDLVEVESTIRHHHLAGFTSLLVFAPEQLELPATLEDPVHRIDFDISQDDALINAVNRVIDAAPGLWLYYCFNAEYLFHPFCETRSIGELTTFQTEERRDAVLTYVIDLYADDLEANPDAVSLENAWMDKSGYYALGRPNSDNDKHPKDRQLDFFGGLRWRFEEHIPAPRRKIDRISLFRAKPG